MLNVIYLRLLAQFFIVHVSGFRPQRLPRRNSKIAYKIVYIFLGIFKYYSASQIFANVLLS